jgi:hypothetical protein
MVLPISVFLSPALRFAHFPGCSAVPVPMVLLATFLPLAASAVRFLALQPAPPRPDEFPLRAFFPPAGNLHPLLPGIDLLSVDLRPIRPVTLQWDPNLEADVAGYKVYYGTSSGQYQYYVDVGKTTFCTLQERSRENQEIFPDPGKRRLAHSNLADGNLAHGQSPRL